MNESAPSNTETDACQDMLKFGEFLTERRTAREISRMTNRQDLEHFARQLEQKLIRHGESKKPDLHAYIGDAVQYFSVLFRLKDLE